MREANRIKSVTGFALSWRNRARNALFTILALGVCAILVSNEGGSATAAEVGGEQVGLLNLSDEDRAYLQNIKAVKMCIDPDWMPYEKIDERGGHVGMSADYMALFEQRIGIPIRLVPTASWSETLSFGRERRCDILSLLNESPERSEFLNFTTPYVEAPIVLVTRDDVTFLEGISALGDRLISTPKGYIYEERIKNDYPEINLVTVPTATDGLMAVSKGKIFTHLGSLFVVVNQMQQHQLSNLKITGHTEYVHKLAIGVRNDDPVLLAILDKAVRSISQAEHIEIRRKWTATKIEHGFDTALLWKVIIGGLVLLTTILLWNRKLAHLNARVRKSEEDLRTAQEIAHIGSWSLDLTKNELIWSEEIFQIFGIDIEKFGASYEAFLETIHPDDRAYVQEQYEDAVEGNSLYDIEHRIIRNNNGEVRWVHQRCAHIRNESGKVIRSDGIIQDITERKLAQDEISHLAITDHLTDLTNRRHFHQRFDENLKLARREEKRLALMALDLDRFKPVNDTYGHLVGDAVLQNIGKIFTEHSRETDVVARLGGDEFAILLVHPDDKEAAKISAQRIIDEVEKTMTIMGHEIQIGVSIGITLFPDDADNEEELFRRADMALYEAKKSGRNTFRFYKAELDGTTK